jgi:hypothetical protein
VLDLTITPHFSHTMGIFGDSTTENIYTISILNQLSRRFEYLDELAQYQSNTDLVAKFTVDIPTLVYG